MTLLAALIGLSVLMFQLQANLANIPSFAETRPQLTRQHSVRALQVPSTFEMGEKSDQSETQAASEPRDDDSHTNKNEEGSLPESRASNDVAEPPKFSKQVEVSLNKYGAYFDGSTFTLKAQIQFPPNTRNVGYFFLPQEGEAHEWARDWRNIIEPILVRRHGFKVLKDGANITDMQMVFTEGRVSKDPFVRTQLTNSIGFTGGVCIGGSKSEQLECKRNYVSHFGCSYEDLPLQPRQFYLFDLEECREFFEREKKNRGNRDPNKIYLVKASRSSGGHGIRIYKGLRDIYRKYHNCDKKYPTIIMDYILNVATWGGNKYDFRSYMLIASMKPELVFYHDGFVRRSNQPYNVSSADRNIHVTNANTQQKDASYYFNFDQMAESIHQELKLPRNYFDVEVRPKLKHYTKFIFKSAGIRRVPGRFHIVGIDWMLDSSGRVYLIEANKNPMIRNYPIQGLTPMIWETMLELVLLVQAEPQNVPRVERMTVKDGYTFGKWELIHNGVEEAFNKQTFNPCMNETIE